MGYMKQIWQMARDVEPGNAFQARDAAQLLVEDWGLIHGTDVYVIQALILDAADMQAEVFYLAHGLSAEDSE